MGGGGRGGGGGGGGEDVSSVLDDVERLIEENRLVHAAEVLERHTRGTAAAKEGGEGVVEALRARAALETGGALLQARARALCASLA